MAFCKYCGKKLGDGESCTCEEAVAKAKEEAEKAEAENAEEVTREAPAEGETESTETAGSDTAADSGAEGSDTAAYSGAENADTASDSGAESDTEEKKPPVAVVTGPPVPAPVMSATLLRRGLILVCALAMCLVLFIVVVGNIAGNGYKRPLKNAVRGLNKERAELVINSFYPRGYVEELRDDAEDGDSEWSDVTDDMDSLIANVKEVCEDEYFGDDLKVSAKIVKKKPATAKDIRTLKKEFEKYDAVVKKAYRLKVKLTVKGDDEKEQVHFYIYSVKVKGGRWVLYADDKTKGTIADKTKDVYKEMDKELAEVFEDYSRSLDLVIPKE
ncbi:MAG: hypothetical protein IKW87_01720 [Ruminococcus sp.]|nr:hypothetical protein [Ruminococcus sp.]